MSRKRIWDEARLQDIREMQDIGMCKSDIARHYGMTRAALANACVRYNIEPAVQRLFTENQKLRQLLTNAGISYE